MRGVERFFAFIGFKGSGLEGLVSVVYGIRV